MKFVALVLAFLMVGAGCGTVRPKKPVDEGEIRHPSNEMNPPGKPAEPEPKGPRKLVAARRVSGKPASRASSYEDPRRIPAGIDYAEMVRRFGPPSMRVTDSPTRTTYSYSKLKTQVQVEVQNGRVVSVAAINTGF